MYGKSISHFNLHFVCSVSVWTHLSCLIESIYHFTVFSHSYYSIYFGRVFWLLERLWCPFYSPLQYILDYTETKKMNSSASCTYPLLLLFVSNNPILLLFQSLNTLESKPYVYYTELLWDALPIHQVGFFVV